MAKSYSQLTQTYLQSHGLTKVWVRDAATDVPVLRYMDSKQVKELKRSGRAHSMTDADNVPHYTPSTQRAIAQQFRPVDGQNLRGAERAYNRGAVGRRISPLAALLILGAALGANPQRSFSHAK